jgi:hypothetical protein
MIPRRTFLSGTGAVVLTAPLAVEAQQTLRGRRRTENCPARRAVLLLPTLWSGLGGKRR